MMEIKSSTATPESLIRTYIRAKDENRPHLMEHVFAGQASLEIIVKTAAISFPAFTKGLEPITDVLVRSFAVKYENIYTFCLERPNLRTRETGFSCDWFVGMSEREGGNVRLGCGRYDWRFSPEGLCLVDRLVITIEVMQVLSPGRDKAVFDRLSGLPYPWCSVDVIAEKAAGIEGIGPVIEYLIRSEKA
jgi:hypothetical protein